MSSCFYQPSWAQQFSSYLTVAESTRLGGVGQTPYESLNLGLFTKDKDEVVAQNRKLFCNALGWDAEHLSGGHQVHGDQVLRVHRPGQWEGYDAFITNRANVLLSVTIADCTPVLIFDPVQRAIGAAHAGWRGTVAGIAGKLLRHMRDAYSTQAVDCWAFVGTCIGRDDFEVDEDVATHFKEEFKHWDEERGKYLVDLKAANTTALRRMGVPADQIEVSDYSTVQHNDRYFSHRAEKGKTGRMLAVIGLRARK
ncbi:MAG: peptidoglycan editing factor PgeF [Bacteroidota bacterium]